MHKPTEGRMERASCAFRINGSLTHDRSQVKDDQARNRWGPPKGGKREPVGKAGTQIGRVQGTSTMVKSEEDQRQIITAPPMVTRAPTIVITYPGQSTDVQDEQEKNDEQRGDAP